MARAYATFANGGYRVDGKVFGNQPRAITQIDDAQRQGRVRRTRRSHGACCRRAGARCSTQLLQGVVTSGTGTAAALPNRPVAGKTGTTENYGDAWFVGYTPQLVTAVWVGYPKGLRPMLTEYHGGPVAGGTFPAQIWKTFMESALDAIGARAGELPVAAVPVGRSRGASRTATAGSSSTTAAAATRRSLVYFSGPRAGADGELQAERGRRAERRRLDARRRARATRGAAADAAGDLQAGDAGQRVGVVVAPVSRDAARSRRSTTVTLVLAKPLHGTVPNIVGLNLRQARAKLAQAASSSRQSLRRRARPGEVVAQEPRAGVAAAPGMTVRAQGRNDRLRNGEPARP